MSLVIPGGQGAVFSRQRKLGLKKSGNHCGIRTTSINVANTNDHHSAHHGIIPTTSHAYSSPPQGDISTLSCNFFQDFPSGCFPIRVTKVPEYNKEQTAQLSRGRPRDKPILHQRYPKMS
jgi:hypothetical protein